MAKIGGHFVFFNYDASNGDRFYTNSAGSQTNYSGKYMGMYPSWLILYINHVINDWLTFEFTPQIQNVTGATPSLGRKIGDGKTQSATAFNLKVGETPTAKVIMRLPDESELVVGSFYQRFTWGYGDEASWQNHMMIPRQYYRSGQNIHENGVQWYKEWDVLGYSLPVTLALGNGNSWRPDKDQGLSYLAKIEPEFLGAKFHFTGYLNNLGLGGVSNDYRISTGIEYSSGPWYFRNEYFYTVAKFGRQIQNLSAPTPSQTVAYRDSAIKYGYNIILKYRLNDKLSLESVYCYDQSNGTTVYDWTNYVESYKDLYFGAIYTLADGVELISTIEFGNYFKCDPAIAPLSLTTYTYDNIVFNRVEVGTKVTF